MTAAQRRLYPDEIQARQVEKTLARPVRRDVRRMTSLERRNFVRDHGWRIFSRSEQAVLDALLSRGTRCFPSVERLAQDARVSVETVRRVRDALRAKGWLDYRVSQRPGRRARTFYVVGAAFDARAAEHLTSRMDSRKSTKQLRLDGEKKTLSEDSLNPHSLASLESFGTRDARPSLSTEVGTRPEKGSTSVPKKDFAAPAVLPGHEPSAPVELRTPDVGGEAPWAWVETPGALGFAHVGAIVGDPKRERHGAGLMRLVRSRKLQDEAALVGPAEVAGGALAEAETEQRSAGGIGR